MPSKKYGHYSFSQSTANSTTKSQAAGAASHWGGPVGKAPIQHQYIPPKEARNR